VRLTVLGSAASTPGPAQACAGHYLEAEGACVLFDCGNGVVSNLARISDPTALDAVFITHNHPDHYADIYVLHAALRYAPDGPRAPIPLYAPPGLADRMKLLLSERGAGSFDEAFVQIPLVDGEFVQVGELRVTPFEVVHTAPTFGLRAEAGGTSLFYTADTAPCGNALEAARGVDLLVAEATLPEEYAGMAPHMTATEAGRLAREAGVRALALVHVWPTNDRGLMAQHAGASFGGPVLVAEEFDVFDITPVDGRTV
jgi:ribonuclease BN (tRNA processing enzyme)